MGEVQRPREPQRAVHPAKGETPLILRGALPSLGALVAYPMTFRNAQSFCTPATIKITNGGLAFWTP